MSSTYVIEIGEKAAGLITQERRGVRFHSALPGFDFLDGKLFATSRAVERALQLHIHGVRSKARPQSATARVAANA